MRVCLISAVILVMSLMQGASAKSDEDRLVAKLLEDFLPVGRIARPVSSARDNVTVTLQMSLQRIASLKDNIVKLDLWLHMKWKDPRLTWRPADYSDLSSVALPAELLWLPDIRPYNAIEYESKKEFTSRVLVSHDGQVVHVQAVRIASPCEVAKNRTATCQLQMSSGAYNADQVDIVLPDFSIFGAAFSEESTSYAYEVLSTDAKREALHFTIGSYTYVKCTLKFKPKGRRSRNSKKSARPKRFAV